MGGLDDDFAEFADAQLSRLLGLSYCLTGNPHDAWDLVQEAMVRVGMRWHRLRGEDPAAYARTVIVHLNVDRLRRLRREFPVRQPRDATVPVLQIGEVEQWLVEALADCSPRERTAIALRFVEDLDVAHIAERMGCTSGTAKSHLSRGIKKLRTRAAVTCERQPEEV